MNAKVSNASPPSTPPTIGPVLDVEEGSGDEEEEGSSDAEEEGSGDAMAIGSGVTAKKSR